eukprot:COSAG01_NODE_2_length_63927_cov_1357.611941_41_plen_169_part_00
MDLKLEVIIIFKENHYEAKTPSFPKCIGKDKTVEGALENLTASISSEASKSIHDLFTKVLKKKNFTEIVSNQKSKNDINHRVYDFSEIDTPFKKELLFQYTPESQSEFNSLYTNKANDNAFLINNAMSSSSITAPTEESFPQPPFNIDDVKTGTQIQKKLFVYPISLN